MRFSFFPFFGGREKKDVVGRPLFTKSAGDELSALFSQPCGWETMKERGTWSSAFTGQTG